MVALAEPKTWSNATARTSSLSRSHPHKLRSAYPRSTYATSGLRFYKPEISRWISRDPVGETRSASLYYFGSNNPVNEVDPKGELSFKIQTKAYILRKCRSVRWVITWVLDPTERDGYIIQWITEGKSVTACGKAMSAPRITQNFYEVWVVKNNKIYMDEEGTRPASGDEWIAHAGTTCSYGALIVRGHAMYWAGKLPSNFVMTKTSRGTQLRTTSNPTAWTPRVPWRPSIQRSLHYTWNCCKKSWRNPDYHRLYAK
jgi:RHS repeat-associated protein